MLKAAIVGWAVFVAASDLRRRRIPNLLSLGAVGMALLVLVTHGSSALGGSVVSAALATGIAIALTLPAYIGRVLGAGDVKLAVAMGLLSDVATFGAGFVVGAIFAGVWAATCQVMRRIPFLVRPCSPRHVRDGTPAATRRTVPFGAALCAGFTVSVLLRGVTQGV